MIRHRWSAPDRRPHESIRACIKCGLVKISHHEFDDEAQTPIHWSEYVDVDGRKFIRLPACSPIEVAA